MMKVIAILALLSAVVFATSKAAAANESTTVSIQLTTAVPANMETSDPTEKAPVGLTKTAIGSTTKKAKVGPTTKAVPTVSPTKAGKVDPMKAIQEKLNTLLKTVRTIEISINKQNNRLDILENKLEAGNTRVKNKIDGLEKKLTSHDTKFGYHRTNINTNVRKLQKLAEHLQSFKNDSEKLSKTLKDHENNLKEKGETMEVIGRQLMQQQTFVEESIRSEGMSGVKSTRISRQGTRPYYASTHVGMAALTAHDHPDFDRTIGLGELDAVMNGVDFRTRHNDYQVVMPSTTSDYNAVDKIPFPDVPPEVLEKKTLDEQIDEMRQWFKAFKDQDHSVRDYRKYFKPNLCYLEGGWTVAEQRLYEPFESKRHFIDASSWRDLQQKIKFTSYTGSKSNKENYAYLPTTMYDYKDGVPQMAQWNYRILCHPVKEDIPLSYFELQDDLHVRLSRKMKWDDVADRRVARFKLNEYGTHRTTLYTMLDKIMGQIPGKDNYGNNLTDDAFGLINYDVSAPRGQQKVLRTGYYHRFFKLLQKGAMGLQVNHRGFRDENMWVAMTTQPKIMPVNLKLCPKRGDCQEWTTRVTYALPLEIIYTTPLQAWNPYNISYVKDKVATSGKRNGNMSLDMAFNGSSFKHYYRTPVEFYQITKQRKDKADTTKVAVGVLDPQGNLRELAPSGFRIMTASIPDVGKVRTRYPIYPVHSEGTAVGMELGAMREMLMKMSRNAKYFETSPYDQKNEDQVGEHVHFQLAETHQNPPGLHGHEFTLSPEEYQTLTNSSEIRVTTSYNLYHNHEILVRYNKRTDKYYIKECDGLERCWDGHWKTIYKE